MAEKVGIKIKPVKTSSIFQMEVTECGAASLGMVMQHYGVHVPLEQLRIDTGVCRDGCKASKIIQGARKYGFEANGFRMGMKALFETKPPCVIHWNFNHFMVYEGKTDKYVYVNDPAQGRRKLTIEEFDRGFTGVVLTFAATNAVQKIGKKKTLFKFINERLNNQYKDIFYLLLIGLILVVPGVILPALSKYYIDDVLNRGKINVAQRILAAMLLTVIIQQCLLLYRNWMVVKLQTKMSLISSYFFTQHMLKLPMSFFSQRYTGDLISRVGNNDSVNEFLVGELATSVLNVFITVFYLSMLFYYSWILALIGLFIVIMNFIILKVTSENFARTIIKVQQDQGKLIGMLYSGVDIITTLKASGIENKYVSRILGYYCKFVANKQKNGKIQRVLNALPEIVKQVCDVLVLITGGVLIIHGKMTMGKLVAFFMLLNAFIQPVNELMRFTEKIQQIKADMNRVEDIIQYGKGKDGDCSKVVKQARISSKLSGTVTMKDISFGYSPLDKPLIEEFNFDLEPGRSIAFVGSSGSGKSTVSKILSGLYNPWNGEVLFDGLPLESIPKEVLSGSVSTVSQEIVLFSGTIRDNITLWNKSIREEDIIRAAKDAIIHDDITLKPNAYDYYLEGGGRNISGGQKQRLEIARALALNPSILIMDEATSALDALTEKEIVDNIKRRGCTCIIVAHRLSAIRDCDEIVVLDSGKIAQRGTHEKLAACDGIYKTLFVENN